MVRASSPPTVKSFHKCYPAIPVVRHKKEEGGKPPSTLFSDRARVRSALARTQYKEAPKETGNESNHNHQTHRGEERKKQILGTRAQACATTTNTNSTQHTNNNNNNNNKALRERQTCDKGRGPAASTRTGTAHTSPLPDGSPQASLAFRGRTRTREPKEQSPHLQGRCGEGEAEVGVHKSNDRLQATDAKKKKVGESRGKKRKERRVSGDGKRK